MVQQKEKPRAAPQQEQPQGERDAADYAARAAAIQNDPTLSDEQKREATVALAKGMTGNKESGVSPQHYAAHLGTGGSGKFYPNGQPSELNVGNLNKTKTLTKGKRQKRLISLSTTFSRQKKQPFRAAFLRRRVLRLRQNLRLATQIKFRETN